MSSIRCYTVWKLFYEIANIVNIARVVSLLKKHLLLFIQV